MGKTTALPRGWKSVRFDYLFDRLTRRNSIGNKNVLTISARHGLINQEAFFKKTVASNDLSNYYLLERGDFAYNKSYSAGYNFGAFKRLTRYDKGVVSPLYICFTVNEKNKFPEFYVHYFESMLLDREIKAFAQEGARNHGLLNIAIGDFFAMKLPLPPLPEQRAIAEILTAQDRLIETKVRLIDAKKRQKRWLMQKLLMGKKSVSLQSMCDVFCDGDWIESKDQSESGIRLIQTGNIGVGQFVDKAERKRFISFETFKRLNCTSVKIGDVLISRLPAPAGRACIVPDIGHEMITAVDCTIVRFREYNPVNFVSYTQTAHYQKQIDILLAGSTRQRISRSELGKIKIPVLSNIEQSAIAERLTAADREIELLTRELEQQKLVKKWLMQQLLTGKKRVKGKDKQKHES